MLSEFDNDRDRVTLCPGRSLGVDALMYGLLMRAVKTRPWRGSYTTDQL
jgi:hypothetical protein